MRALILILLGVVACLSIKPIKIPDIPLPELQDLENPLKIAEVFGNFKKNFGKKYDDPIKASKVQKVFSENLKKIVKMNKEFKDKGKKIVFGLNKYSDLTDAEFGKAVLMKRPPKSASSEFCRNHTSTRLDTAPASFDWRTKENVVSPVKYQGECGCCWAFTTAAMVTGAYGLKNNQLVEPSEQQICDCAGAESDPGCGGGFINKGLQYAKDKGLVATAGYTAYDEKRAVVTGTCEDGAADKNIFISDFAAITSGSASDIRDQLLAKGPIGMAFAVGPSFRHYKSGIFTNDDCLNEATRVGWHAVTAVGYGSEDGQDYWIFKNSWDTSFGEEGYFRYIRGTDLCFIETDHVFSASG